MTAPAFLTRIDIEPGRILVEVEVLTAELEVIEDEQAARLRGRLHEAVEDALAGTWPNEVALRSYGGTEGPTPDTEWSPLASDRDAPEILPACSECATLSAEQACSPQGRDR